MLLPPVGRGRHPLRPGQIGLLGGQGDPGQGGVGGEVEVPESSRDGMGTITSRPVPYPRPPPEVASLRPPQVRPERADASLRSLEASLGARPPAVPWAASLSSPCTCTRWCGVHRRRAWCRISGDHTWNGTYRHGKMCKAPIEEGETRMEQCNNETNKLDEIRTNSR